MHSPGLSQLRPWGPAAPGLPAATRRALWAIWIQALPAQLAALGAGNHPEQGTQVVPSVWRDPGQSRVAGRGSSPRAAGLSLLALRPPTPLWLTEFPSPVLGDLQMGHEAAQLWLHDKRMAVGPGCAQQCLVAAWSLAEAQDALAGCEGGRAPWKQFLCSPEPAAPGTTPSSSPRG